MAAVPLFQCDLAVFAIDGRTDIYRNPRLSILKAALGDKVGSSQVRTAANSAASHALMVHVEGRAIERASLGDHYLKLDLDVFTSTSTGLLRAGYFIKLSHGNHITFEYLNHIGQGFKTIDIQVRQDSDYAGLVARLRSLGIQCEETDLWIPCQPASRVSSSLGPDLAAPTHPLSIATQPGGPQARLSRQRSALEPHTRRSYTAATSQIARSGSQPAWMPRSAAQRGIQRTHSIAFAKPSGGTKFDIQQKFLKTAPRPYVGQSDPKFLRVGASKSVAAAQVWRSSVSVGRSESAASARRAIARSEDPDRLGVDVQQSCSSQGSDRSESWASADLSSVTLQDLDCPEHVLEIFDICEKLQKEVMASWREATAGDADTNESIENLVQCCLVWERGVRDMCVNATKKLRAVVREAA